MISNLSIYPKRPKGKEPEKEQQKKVKRSRTSKFAKIAPTSKVQNPTHTTESPEQLDHQKPRQEPSKTHRRGKGPSKSKPVALPGVPVAKSIKVSIHAFICGIAQLEAKQLLQSAQVASWAGGVNQEVLQDVLAVPAVNHLSALGKNLTSAPWYRSYGYGSSEEDMPSPSIVSSGRRSKAGGPAKPKPFDAGSKGFLMSLQGRNVEFDEVADESKEWIKQFILPEQNELSVTQDERHWELDLLKCAASEEAVFQRTVMMDLIDRHQLGGTLDYTCESQWQCARMPQRGGELANRMPKPKPDLAVAFISKPILPSFQQADLGDFRNTMCPENVKEGQYHRAFHFLSIEAKGASGDIANCKAHRQNFNTATQALHNMYFFMQKAGTEQLKGFFEKVRFYSVVATSKSFFVRVHRAVRVEKGQIEGGYPLGFLYDTVYIHDGAGYTKAKTTRIIKNILLEYGIGVLQPLLKETMELVWQKLQIQPEQESRESIEQQNAWTEAENHRSRRRAQSRHSQNATAGLRSSRKTPDTSFTRQGLNNLAVDGLNSGSSSGVSESRTSK